MNFTMYQIDMKTAFLYGDVKEEIYVSQPPGFIDSDNPQQVFKLDKALYSLHKAPRAWYATLTKHLLSHGYVRGAIDQTLFRKQVNDDIILVQIYVDDIIFGSTNNQLCKDFEQIMRKKFEMSSLGEMIFFLGLQVRQDSSGIVIHQGKYVDDILAKFKFDDCKAVNTPIATCPALTVDEDCQSVDHTWYRFMIGSLMYFTASRPDIMFAVCQCARYQANPKLSHLHVVKKIFRYLKGKPRLGLWKSTSGGCQFLGDRHISWHCKKQHTVSTSTAEAEYVAASTCCSQVIWIQTQLLDYGLEFLNSPVFCDNDAAIQICKNPVQHSKTKHIDIKVHFIRDCFDRNLIHLEKIDTSVNTADLFTKAIDRSRFNVLTELLKMLRFCY
ncbi:hypothetical protein E3N88_23380 [Mikania micrantha]|uniref:Reverse transcriptase Ty1/copia-type domain-containing protein n=1 Tax=Mikania micrantha TaxID=192012 RepID=A0A5N6NE94_9ASTR|nr:hypothetical protein E3N88_23380 [Mikania micrantha]